MDASQVGPQQMWLLCATLAHSMQLAAPRVHECAALDTHDARLAAHNVYARTASVQGSKL